MLHGALDVLVHARRLAQQDVQRQIDRRVAEVAVMEHDAALFRGRADDGVLGALALAEALKHRQVLRHDGQHIALLGLVAPDLQRRHAWLVVGHLAQLEVAAHAAVGDELGHGVGQAAGAHVMDEHDRVAIA